jgi:hypothetical protein
MDRQPISARLQYPECGQCFILSLMSPYFLSHSLIHLQSIER